MTNYAEAKVPEDEKLDFQNSICAYYSSVCIKLYNTNGKSYKKVKEGEKPPEMQHQLMERLLQYETNIFACIQRLIEGRNMMP